tara:strand:+ start:391 stop:1500 length:1110 start_codon:yes stop_codon:yes gene_type:complete
MKRQLISLVIKEFLAVWRDKQTRSVLILPPLLQLFLFSFAATLEVKNIDIVFYNQDSGKHSIELIQRVVASPKVSQSHYVYNERDLADMIHQQKALLGVRFPPNFSKDIQQRESGKLQLLLDGRRSNTATVVSGYINDISESYSKEIAKDLGTPLLNVDIIQRSWFNPNLEYSWFTIASLVAILAMMIALVLTSLSVAREREMGTFEQLLVSPVTPNEILLGKTIPAFLIAIAEASIILVLSLYLFGLEFQGSLLLLYSSMVVFLMAIIGIGLFISALCMTQQQAVLGTFLFMTPAVLISGFATPTENMPQWLQYIAELIPLKHFLIVVKGVFLKDMGALTVFQNTWPNAVIAAVTLPLAGWFFKHRMA